MIVTSLGTGVVIVILLGLLSRHTEFNCVGCGRSWMLTSGSINEFTCPECDDDIYATSTRGLHIIQDWLGGSSSDD